jgi:hypothetical protein
MSKVGTVDSPNKRQQGVRIFEDEIVLNVVMNVKSESQYKIDE